MNDFIQNLTDSRLNRMIDSRILNDSVNTTIIFIGGSMPLRYLRHYPLYQQSTLTHNNSPVRYFDVPNSNHRVFFINSLVHPSAPLYGSFQHRDIAEGRLRRDFNILQGVIDRGVDFDRVPGMRSLLRNFNEQEDLRYARARSRERENVERIKMKKRERHVM